MYINENTHDRLVDVIYYLFEALCCLKCQDRNDRKYRFIFMFIRWE